MNYYDFVFLKKQFVRLNIKSILKMQIKYTFKYIHLNGHIKKIVVSSFPINLVDRKKYFHRIPLPFL